MTERIAGPAKKVAETFNRIVDGRFTMTDGDAARPLDTQSTPIFQVQIQNHPNSVGNIEWGNATSQSTVIEPGEYQVVPASNLTIPYVRPQPGSGNITVNYTGMA